MCFFLYCDVSKHPSPIVYIRGLEESTPSYNRDPSDAWHYSKEPGICHR